MAGKIPRRSYVSSYFTDIFPNISIYFYSNGNLSSVCFLIYAIFLSIIIQFQHTHEGLLRNLHVPHLAHPLLSFFLLLQKLLLAADIAAIALGQHIFSHGFDSLPRDDLAAYSRLNRDLKQMSWNFILQLLAHLPAPLIGSRCSWTIKDKASTSSLLIRISSFTSSDLLIALHLIIEGSISSGAGFQSIEEVVDDLIQRKLVFQKGAGLLHIFHAQVDRLGAPGKAP